ncbi:MAG: 6-phosphofructokinase [Candidatus Omnitrophica bacterium]|nr:6-phosphofructokinase [Candidatus Omnitrophota bacterium]
MRRIAILTSGGDAPGMNAAIRSAVRTAIYKNLSVYGVMRGYEGLIDDHISEFNARSVSNILSRGGTVLKTSRSMRFLKKEGVLKAGANLKRRGIDGLIVIGGNGSFKGADEFSKLTGIKTVGIPGTIDNDICGSDYAVGAHTAVDTALDAIDKIRDTVTSMERIYVIEVMGRFEPFIAIRVGLAGGAEDVIFPGNDYLIDDMSNDIKEGRKKGKVSWIIVVSEGAKRAAEAAKSIKKNTGFEVRAITLGHIQRGGSPSAYDRVLASRLGAQAVDALIEDKGDGMVGIVSDKPSFVSFKAACMRDKGKIKLDKEIYNLTKILAI